VISSLEFFDLLIDEGELQHRMSEYYDTGIPRVLDRGAYVVIEDVTILHLASDQTFIVLKPVIPCGSDAKRSRSPNTPQATIAMPQHRMARATDPR
jgi:hypothetical protein